MCPFSLSALGLSPAVEENMPLLPQWPKSKLYPLDCSFSQLGWIKRRFWRYPIKLILIGISVYGLMIRCTHPRTWTGTRCFLEKLYAILPLLRAGWIPGVSRPIHEKEKGRITKYKEQGSVELNESRLSTVTIKQFTQIHEELSSTHYRFATKQGF